MKSGTRITPLWIVAAFVTLTEVVLGYAVTQTQDGVQVALTAFVISFAVVVFGAFIVVLWNRPYVFYPPSEYGDLDPKRFVEAVRPLPRVTEQIALVEKASDEPGNRNAGFAVINSLIDDFPRQLIILMHEKQLSLPFDALFGLRYEVSRKTGQWAGGGFNVPEFARKLEGTELLHIEARHMKLSLTRLGHEFAQWLLDNDCRADFLDTPFGGWGERILPAGMPQELLDRGSPVLVRPGNAPTTGEHGEKSPGDETPASAPEDPGSQTEQNKQQ